MLSHVNMSIVMSLPLKKRPVRVDFSNIEELASPEKRYKTGSECSESSRSGRSSTESAAGSTASDVMMTESGRLSFHPSHYHHSTFIAPLHSSAGLPFLYPYNLQYKYPPQVLRREPIASEQTLNRCHECGKSFTSKTRFRAHQRRHKSKTSGRYQCKQCDKKFVQRSSLTTHTRIHTGERPFKCHDCDDSFGDYSTFTKHQRTHTGEKPYECPVCQRRFSQSGNMHRHFKSVHNQDESPESPILLPTNSSPSMFNY